MSGEKLKRKGRVMWGVIYVTAFIAAFVLSAVIKVVWNPLNGKYSVQWDDSVGTIYTDLSYGERAANKFDLYVPADGSRDRYGLVVYLHAGASPPGTSPATRRC